ncbi:MAG: hypothetical protein JOZ74_18190, partial [Bradyrhizobium sp.]|nr:hypothetical protein [Bradyrhizobium sp.]
MLPGFRFLFSAIALSVSILIFGLGAAALLRAAHEEFASNPSWRAAPEQPMLAQQQIDATKPVLALLQVEPPREAAALPTATNASPATALPTISPAKSAPSEPESVASMPFEADKAPALNPQDR